MYTVQEVPGLQASVLSPLPEPHIKCCRKDFVLLTHLPLDRNMPANLGVLVQLSPFLNRKPGLGRLRGWLTLFSSNFRAQDPSFSLLCFLCVLCRSLSCVLLFSTPWTVARQAPLSVGFSRQEDCSGLPFPPPGDLPNPGIEPVSLSSSVYP